MVHAHTCRNCGVVLSVGPFDCGVEDDHEYGICDRCAGMQEGLDDAVDIGGEG
jgi:hypothetical protein